MAAKPIVVGVDGSEESMRAAEWAADEAHRHEVPLLVVSAAAMPPRMRARDSGLRTVADELCGESARALGEAVSLSAEASSQLVIDASLLIGPPALAVTDSGAGALMLVVGARGAGGFAAMLLGSVSRYAAMHASCPVIVVREGQASDVRPRLSLASATRRTPRRWHSPSTRPSCAGRAWSSSTPGMGSRPRPGGRPTRRASRRKRTKTWPSLSSRGGASTLPSPSGRMWSTITPRGCSPATAAARTSL